MGRLSFLAVVVLGLVCCDTPSHNHDLTPLEQAVAGYWEKTYVGFGDPSGADLEHLELRPDRTGHWFVSRSKQSILSNTLYIHHWEVSGDSLRLQAHIKSITVPRPDGTEYTTDSIALPIEFVPLHLSQDSVILKEVCNLQKNNCAGVQTWYNKNSLAELLAGNPDSLTYFLPPRRLKEIK